MWRDEGGRVIEERKHFLAVVILVVIGTVIYANSFGNGFVWDDFPLLVHNSRIRNLGNIPAMFLDLKGGGYRPLREASYALDYFFWGLNPWGYHLGNLLLHLLNAVLVYLIINRLFGRWKLALLVAIFFVSHPIATESVTWISGRRDVLTAFFFFLSENGVEPALLLPLKLSGKGKEDDGEDEEALISMSFLGSSVQFEVSTLPPESETGGTTVGLLEMPPKDCARERPDSSSFFFSFFSSFFSTSTPNDVT